LKKLNVDDFLAQAQSSTIYDVRSPAEYAHACIPQARSLPLFTDTQRAEVGTAYKQRSRQQAIKIGLQYFGPKMLQMVEEVEHQQLNNGNTVLVHCWRGGMRSGAVAWLLNMYGFEVYTLAGGYKAFRNWVLAQLEQTYSFRILGGYTGSAKTEILAKLAHSGHTVIDLEQLAKHQGSALGGINQPSQPSQEMFENQLAMELFRHKKHTIWLEDESQRIGNLKLPNSIKDQMQTSPMVFLEIERQQRLQYLIKNYGKLPTDKLITAILRIKKRLGGLDTKNAINHLVEGDTAASFDILLRYYDKYYAKGLQAKPAGKVQHLAFETINTEQIAEAILSLNN
jgi:tRNA 2-selenouridine synthase